MNSLVAPFVLLPGALDRLIQSLRLREQDPYLRELRWRLHLRLLALTIFLTLGFFLLALGRGRFNETGAGALATGFAWFWLRSHPQHNRLVVRAVVALFLVIGGIGLLGPHGSQTPWTALALMVMTVFGTLLDGLLTGLVAATAASAIITAALISKPDMELPLVVAFTLPATACFFLTSLAHTWIFNRVVQSARASSQAVQATGEATATLARMLGEEVTRGNARLREGLAAGLDGLGEAGRLRGVLGAARQHLPANVPRNAVEPGALFDGLRSDVHRFFMVIGLGVELAVTFYLRLKDLPLWYLPCLLAAATAALLWAGPGEALGWRTRLRLFLLFCMVVVGADLVLSRANPPAASVVFLPLLTFYAGMLLGHRQAWLVAAAGAAMMAAAFPFAAPLRDYVRVFTVVGMLNATMAVLSQSTVPLYAHLLGLLEEEEERLHAGLQAYRRLVSTLFHDLANPLAVLQALAALPPEARRPDDGLRAARMVERLESISAAALRSAQNSVEALHRVDVAALADGLRDIFRERLQARGLRLELAGEAGLSVRQGGSLLRDSILGNLVSNAIQFSPEGGTVTLEARRGGGGLRLSVLDQGRGYSQATLSDLDQDRSPNPEARPSGDPGSGFGLLLAKAYARDLGGHLRLENAPEGGARAELWLPD